MSPQSTRSVTLRANPAEAFAALRQAARRTGFQLLSSDASAGTATFTSARVMLNFGEKVNVRIAPAGPGAIQVTLTSTPALSPIGRSGRVGAGAERMATALSDLLPSIG